MKYKNYLMAFLLGILFISNNAFAASKEEIDEKVKSFLTAHNLDYNVVDGTPEAPCEIMKHLGIYRERIYRD